MRIRGTVGLAASVIGGFLMLGASVAYPQKAGQKPGVSTAAPPHLITAPAASAHRAVAPHSTAKTAARTRSTGSQNGETRRRHRASGVSGTYIFGGGYYVPVESDDQGPAQPAADAAESTDAQQDSQQQEPQQSEQNAQQIDADAEPSTPEVPDEGQFTLVLNDGTQIQTVAFSHSKDKIVYITPEGGRRSVFFSDVDADATVRVNQERGTPLQLPL